MNELIYLRPLTIEDAATSFQWRNDPEIWKFTMFRPPAPITLDMESKWLQNALLQDDQQRFAICLSNSKRYIGNVQLIHIANGTAEFHLFVAEKEYWGKGIGAQATMLMLDYAFNTLQLNQVNLEVHRENLRAFQIYKKAGFLEADNGTEFTKMTLSASDYQQEIKPLCKSRLLTLADEEAWKGFIKKALRYDFYHSWVYHLLDNSAGTALLFVYEEGTDFIAVPLLKRRIPDTEYYDMSSVYGYSGPVSNLDLMGLSAGFSDRFKTSFLNFLKEHHIVSVFSRLNPFLGQTELMQRFGGVVDNGKVVVLDLSISLEEQQERYRGGLSRKIKRLRQKGYYVKEGRTDEDIKMFSNIYRLNMLRVEALDSYYFEERYFKTLLNSNEFEARLLFVCDQNDYAVCGTLIVITNNIVQGHLMATRAEALSDSPGKLLIEEVTVLGRKLGLKYYNLGGGLGFKEDSLFLWKSNFSGLTLNYQSWRFVANEEVYTALLHQHGIDPDSGTDFFPLYRSQSNKLQPHKLST